MCSVKTTPQEIYEVLEQQKKLLDVRTRLAGILDKVNQTINSITIENIELTTSQIESLKDEDEDTEKKPKICDPVEQEKKAVEINKQLIDLETKFSHFENESDEDLSI